MKQVVIILFPGTKLLDATGPLQVFNDARTAAGKPAYLVTLASTEGGDIATDTGVFLATRSLVEVSKYSIDTLLVSGGTSAFEAANAPALMAWLQQHGMSVRRLGSICLGAFILAKAGFLSGRKVVTHWANCEQLARAYPDIVVASDPIYIKSGDIWTSAGVSAGIDMALAMVEEDLGRTEALRLARSLVLYLKRPGGQAQYSTELQRQTDSSTSRFESLHAMIRSNLSADFSVAKMADMVGMSERNFARVYKNSTGRNPAQAVEIFRVEVACRLLEDGRHSIKEIAILSGFGLEERMRRAFQKHRGVAPSHYQARFGKIDNFRIDSR